MEQDELLSKLQTITAELVNTSSRNEKKAILTKYSDDTDFKMLLKYVYDPFIIFGIGTKKLEKDLKSNINNNDNDYTFFKLLSYLSEHNTGSYKEVHLVRCFIDKHYKYKDFISAVITKKLILGIDTKVINSVFPNLCNTFNVMLANKYFDKPEIVEGKEFALTTKIDGGRIIALKKDGVVKFYTRQGQPYEGLIDLKTELENIKEDNFCLDGEITLLDSKNLTSKDQYKQTMMITRKDGEKHGVKMLVFDAMPVDDFNNQSCNIKYSHRRVWLEKFLEENNLTYFTLVNILYQGTDTSKIIEYLNYNIEHGEEGVMINIVDAPYEFKRTSNLLKVKKMNTLDLKCIGFEEGTGKNKNKLGALLVQYKNDNIVKVGSGFTDELRNEIWNNQDLWLNRIIEVQYFEETTNQEGGISLRFPVYIDYRLDKIESDY